MEAMPDNKHFTWADYLTWEDDIRYELIDGTPHMMTAPSRQHQSISGALFNQLYNFLKDKPCEVYAAPFDVRLNPDDRDDTVVQPDIVVVCDSTKLDDRGCMGAPDLVVEILSSSSDIRDRVLKFNKYLQAGVREYWIVNPDNSSANVFIWENGKYTASAYGKSDTLSSHTLPGCVISLADIFGEQT